MPNLRFVALAASFMLPVWQTALADGHASCALSYEVYEYSVPHTDLEDCPAVMAGEGQFCRVAVMAEVATIFAFSEETGCLVAARAFEEDGFSLTFK